MSRHAGVVVLALLLALHGCSVASCTPLTIVVTDKDAHSRLQSEPRGLRSDELGRVKEQRREVIVTEYWVRDEAHRWHRVSASDWMGAQPGQPLEICR
jgi:hypothetical protein